jgi:molybdopterin-guanine dinucleotide biosynthesis protein A
MKVLGAILAGGRSSRFGSDKATALFDGRPLIDCAITTLRDQVDEVIICGPSKYGFRCIADRPVPGLGPLGGINAALLDADDRGFDIVVTLPCDTPIIPDELVSRLTAAGVPSFVISSPVIGCWPASLWKTLDDHLATTTDRSMRSWAEQVSANGLDLGSVANINTPQDLERLESYRG